MGRDPGADARLLRASPTCAGAALEFLLDLDVGDLEAQRQRLRARESELQDGQWSTKVRAFRDAQDDRGLMTCPALPESLTIDLAASRPAAGPPVGRRQPWVPIDQYARRPPGGARADLDSSESPRQAGSHRDSEKERLGVALQETDSLRRKPRHFCRDQTDSRPRRAACRRRAPRGTSRGPPPAPGSSSRLERARLRPSSRRLHEDCPVCHQQLPTSLLGTEACRCGRSRPRTPSPTFEIKSTSSRLCATTAPRCAGGKT